MSERPGPRIVAVVFGIIFVPTALKTPPPVPTRPAHAREARGRGEPVRAGAAGELRSKGLLTGDEFQQQKRKLLGG